MLEFCRNMTWRVLSATDGHDVLNCRRVCHAWRHVVDTVSREEWRMFYEQHVGVVLHVSQTFDWKEAALIATAHTSSLSATCVWNRQRVAIVTPWKCARLVYDEAQHALFDTCLRSGVERGTMVDASVVDFVYNDTIRLRGLQRSCVIRMVVRCRNCAVGRRCLDPQYQYFIRPAFDIDPIIVNESLAPLLARRGDG